MIYLNFERISSIVDITPMKKLLSTLKTKNLKFIRGSNINNIVLIDDFSLYVEPSQEDNWIEIDQFDFPYSDDDNELLKIGRKLQNMNDKW